MTTRGAPRPRRARAPAARGVRRRARRRCGPGRRRGRWCPSPGSAAWPRTSTRTAAPRRSSCRDADAAGPARARTRSTRSCRCCAAPWSASPTRPCTSCSSPTPTAPSSGARARRGLLQLGRRRRACSPGTRWSEDAIGTNAMGTTLAVDAPVQIHSAEHLVRAVPRLDLRRRPRARPGHRRDPRRHRHHRPAAHRAPGDGAAGVGHRPAGREPAPGAAGDRRRAAAGAQHAAPDAACAGRAGALVTPTRPDHRRRAVRRWPERVDVAGRRRPRPARRRPRDAGRAAGRGLPAAGAAAAPRPRRRRSALSLRFTGDAAPRGAARRRPGPAHAAPRRAARPRWPCTPTG